MDFKRSCRFLLFITAFIFFIAGCSQPEKSNINNTYYIEMVNFNHDSLKQSVSEKLFGKVAYYKQNKLQVVSLNYLIEDAPDMHFFKNTDELGNKIQPETKKIRIEFGGKFTVDSIRYSLQKFVYREKQWKKTSDMGFIKGVTTYHKARLFAAEEFAKQIVENTIVYSYN
jgi:hypothetical protein